MKTKFAKIFGVALTLVLLVSLFAFAAPASAGTLVWSTVPTPSTTGNVLMPANAQLGPIGQSPDGNTLFASINDLATAALPQVYRSLDGGFSWIPNTTALGSAVGDQIIALEVSDSYASDSTVFVAVQTPAGGAGTGIVYRSTDGGATWGQLGVVTLGAAEIITCMDVSPDYDGTGVIAVGIADIVDAAVPAGATTSVQVWGLGGVLSWTAYSTVAYDVTALEFSPNYPIDATIVVITSLANLQPVMRHIVGGVWGTIAAVNVGATAVSDMDFTIAGGNDNIIVADIALPSDYNGTQPTLRRAYVSIADEAGLLAGAMTTTTSNIYRITNITAGTAIGGTSAWVSGYLAYDGTYATGTLLAGTFGAAASTANVYRTTDPAGSVVFWYGATNAPSGVATAVGPNTWVIMDANYATSSLVYAGTAGDDSAWSKSIDGAVNWNETGLIDNGGAVGAVNPIGTIGDVNLSPSYATDGTIFIITDNLSANAATDTSVWMSTDTGFTWTRVQAANFAGAGVGVLAMSDEYGTDGTCYAGDTGTVNLLYSADNGNSWSARTINAAVGVTIVDMAAPNATDLYVADAVGGSVAKSLNSGWVWSGANTQATGSAGNLISIAVDGSTVVVGDNQSSIFRSDDANATWLQVAWAFAAAANTFVAVDGDIVYGQRAASGAIWRWEEGVSSAWYNATTTALVPAVALGGGITLADDGTMYAIDPTAAANQQVYRSNNPTWGPTPLPPTFEWIAGLGAAAAGAIDVAVGGSNTVAITQGATVQMFDDTLSAGSAGPMLDTPADEAALGGTNWAVLSVENQTGVTSWDIWYTTDPTFTDGVTVIVQVPPATEAAGFTTVTDFPYYWKARATAGAPLRGAWSESRVYYPQLVTAINAPATVSPVGLTAVDVQLTPVFNWGALLYATGYELQVAKAASEADFAADKLVLDLTGANALGPTTSYYLDTPLDYGSAYYWRVRAITGSTTTDWSATVGFTTMQKPPEPPAPVVIEPTPPPVIEIPPAPAPITPGYIWGIIIIGAVLIIAVIVLIVRTRRVI
ncbi:hypothetical protein ACFLVM_03230 [Chloroflexota bacterium]